MQSYLDLLKHVLDNGVEKTKERTGVGTLSTFSHNLSFNLEDGFPLLTTKKLTFRLIFEELMWMVRGNRNIRPLVQKNVHIWDEWPFRRYLLLNGLEGDVPIYSQTWNEELGRFIERVISDQRFADTYGDLGPVYGYLWRRWRGMGKRVVDQLQKAIDLIKTDPDSRRIIVSAWDPSTVSYVPLPPCHILFQFYVSGEKLSLKMYQRSVDVFLGLPFNIAEYALLTILVAHITDLKPHMVHFDLGDTHIYQNHIEHAKLQLSREPRLLPTLLIKNPEVSKIEDFTFEDLSLRGYFPHPKIKAPVAV